MKYLFQILTLFFAISWVSCKNNTENNAKKVDKDANGQAIVLPSDFAVLTDKMWAVDFAVATNDSSAKDFAGKWYKFYDDGHRFDFGRWLEKTNSGTWEYDHDTNFLDLNFEKESTEKKQWKVKVNSSQVMMIWIGSTTRNPSGDQVKLNHVSEMPEKK